MDIIKDLIWFGGPLLSEYDHEGKTFLSLWIDIEHEADVFLVFETDQLTLELYLAKDIPLRELLQCSSSIFRVLFDPTDVATWVPVKFEDLPEENLPTPDSFFFDET